MRRLFCDQEKEVLHLLGKRYEACTQELAEAQRGYALNLCREGEGEAAEEALSPIRSEKYAFGQCS